MTCMLMTFPSNNVPFQWYLPPIAQKKDLMFYFHYIFVLHFYSPTFYLSESHLLFRRTPPFSFMNPVSFSAAIYYLPHILLFFWPTIGTVSCFTLYFTPFLPPSSLPFLLRVRRRTSSSLFTCDLLFLISDSPSDWQISIILEGLHKSLPSHFPAEMAFSAHLHCQ